MMKQDDPQTGYDFEFELINRLFKERFSLVLRERGLTQSELAALLGNRTQSTISRWLRDSDENNFPNFITFLIACKILKINPGYFSDMNMSFQQADLSLKTAPSFSQPAIPVIETTVYARIFQILEMASGSDQVFFISTVNAPNGTTTALRHYAETQSKTVVLVKPPFHLDGIGLHLQKPADVSIAQYLKNNRMLFVFDHVELNRINLDEIIGIYNRTYKCPLVFIGKNISKQLKQNNSLQQISKIFYISTLLERDMEKIIKSQYPAIEPRDTRMILTAARGSIKILISILLNLKVVPGLRLSASDIMKAMKGSIGYD